MPRYEELLRVCASLEALEEAGAADLFWGEEMESGAAESRVAAARSRASSYQNEVSELQAERDRLAADVGRQNLVLEHLDLSLADALEREEARRAEWLIERQDSEEGFARNLVMPWTGVSRGRLPCRPWWPCCLEWPFHSSNCRSPSAMS